MKSNILLEAILYSQEELNSFAEDFCNMLQGNEVIFLIGFLGTGKTTFVKSVARIYGIPENRVISPTFILQKQYKGVLSIFHFDLYRLEHPDQLHDIGFYEQMDQKGIKLVEWADRFPEIEKYADYWVQFQIEKQNWRRIRVLRND